MAHTLIPQSALAVRTPSFVTYMTDSPRAGRDGPVGSDTVHAVGVAGLKWEEDTCKGSVNFDRSYCCAVRPARSCSPSDADSDSTSSSADSEHSGHGLIGNHDRQPSKRFESDRARNDFSVQIEDELDEHDIEATCKMMATALRARQGVYNLCAGPAGLPGRVLAQLCHDILNFEGTGIGVEEMSHRDPGGQVQRCLADTCETLKELLNVPDNYEVLLMQGGAHAQFAAVPLNLLKGKNRADYIDGGFWSQRARAEASKLCEARLVEGMRENALTGKLEYIPPSEWELSPDAAYVHLCANETINGLEFLEDPDLPDKLNRPVVADFTSTLLSRPVDVSKYGVIYASGGKNIGPAGVCVVIVRKDLISTRELASCPGVMSYGTMANTSPIPNLYNTPNMMSVRAVQLMLGEAREAGGLAACQEQCRSRAGRIYQVFDDSNGFYSCNVENRWRSQTTIPFAIRNGHPELEALFRRQAEAVGLYQIFGHHSVGALRVCLYNSVREASITVLLRFLASFQQEHA